MSAWITNVTVIIELEDPTPEHPNYGEFVREIVEHATWEAFQERWEGTLYFGDYDGEFSVNVTHEAMKDLVIQQPLGSVKYKAYVEDVDTNEAL